MKFSLLSLFVFFGAGFLLAPQTLHAAAESAKTEFGENLTMAAENFKAADFATMSKRDQRRMLRQNMKSVVKSAPKSLLKEQMSSRMRLGLIILLAGLAAIVIAIILFATFTWSSWLLAYLLYVFGGLAMTIGGIIMLIDLFSNF